MLRKSGCTAYYCGSQWFKWVHVPQRTHNVWKTFIEPIVGSLMFRVFGMLRLASGQGDDGVHVHCSFPRTPRPPETVRRNTQWRAGSGQECGRLSTVSPGRECKCKGPPSGKWAVIETIKLKFSSNKSQFTADCYAIMSPTAPKYGRSLQRGQRRGKWGEILAPSMSPIPGIHSSSQVSLHMRSATTRPINIDCKFSHAGRRIVLNEFSTGFQVLKAVRFKLMSCADHLDSIQ